MDKSKAMSVNDFGKFVIEFTYNRNQFLTVWGTNYAMDSEDEFLVAKDQRIIKFKDIQSVQTYLNQSGSHISFDEENMREWGQLIPTNYEPERLDFDLLLQFLTDADAQHLDISERSEMRALLSAINIIEDYYFQMNWRDSIKAMNSQEVNSLKGLVRSAFMWRIAEEDLKAIVQEFKSTVDLKILKNQLNQIMNTFINYCG